MKFRRLVPFCITAGILLLGFEGILRAIEGAYLQSAYFIMLAAILDGLDGEVARLFKGVTTFGAKLDTYVDTVCFGVAPAILAYLSVFKEHGFLGWLFVSMIVLSGVVRFSMYQVKESRVKHSTFKGLPIPVNAVWICMITIFTFSNMLSGLGAGVVAVTNFMWCCSAVFLLLQVSQIKYAKPQKDLIGIGLIGLLVAMLLLRKPALAFCAATSLGLLFFVFVTPFFTARLAEAEEEEEEEPWHVSH